MKRSKTSSRAMRARTTADRDGDSHYAQKVKRGDQMYGTGDKRTSCCAHRIKLTHWSG